jgi:hypothetical protein
MYAARLLEQHLTSPDYTSQLYQYDREDFLNLRLVSKTCRYESEYLFYRSVALHDDTRAAKREAIKQAEIIANIDNKVRTYVRQLEFGPFSDEQWFYSSIIPLLEGMLRSIKDLERLTWDTPRALPTAVLILLQSLHPSVRLHLKLRKRFTTTPLNDALLSSPQLHTLDVSLFYNGINEDYAYSELQFFKNHVGDNLRVLRLDLKLCLSEDEKEFPHWNSVQRGPYRFEWKEGDRFPALEELVFDSRKFALTAESCDMWARCTSWNRLQRLDVGDSWPHHFFASLTGCAVNLKYLKFTVRAMSNSTWNWRPKGSELVVLAKFISSITALQELELESRDHDLFSGALSTVLANSKGSLKSLSMRACWSSSKDWGSQRYLDVFEQAPKLESFDAMINEDTMKGSWRGAASFFDPLRKLETAKKNIRALNRISKLQRSKRTWSSW